MKMSRALFECLECNGVDVRDDYSGRFMYGKQCFGYTDDDLARSIFNLAQEFQNIIDNVEDEALQEEADAVLHSPEFEHSCSDNMGLSYIVYFPDIQVE